MRVHVPRIKWWQCLSDFADPLQAVLDELGAGAGEVWFAAHFHDVEPPADAILFQTEVGGSRWFTPAYRAKLARARAVWDYSSVNRGAYECRAWHHVPLRFHPSMERGLREARPERTPAGVGFFGSVNPRRAAVLEEVHIMPPAFGLHRDVWVSRVASVVVPHYYETSPVEQARIGYLLANGIPVVAEHAADECDFPGPEYAPLAELVARARALPAGAGDEQRERYRQAGTAHELVRAALEL